MSLTRILREVRACQTCLPNLPFGPRPVLQVGGHCSPPESSVKRGQQSSSERDTLERRKRRSTAGVADAGIAPSSTMRLELPILPMGFCYPGPEKTGPTGLSPGMRTALAPAAAQVPSRYPVDALVGSIRPNDITWRQSERTHSLALSRHSQNTYLNSFRCRIQVGAAQFGCKTSVVRRDDNSRATEKPCDCRCKAG